MNQHHLDWFAARLMLAVYDTNTEYRMSITGAKFLGDQFRSQLAATKAQLAKASDDMHAAMADLQETAAEATKQVHAVQAETADLKAALGLTSNGGPTVEDNATPTPPAGPHPSYP